MSVSGQLTLAATVSGAGVTESYVPPQSPVTNPSSIGAGPTPIALAASTENAVAVPAGALYALIVPPTTSANAKTLKGTSGDTGFAFTADLALISVRSVSSFVIESTSAETVGILWI